MKRKRIAPALLLAATAAGVWAFLSFGDSSLNYRFENAERMEGVEFSGAAPSGARSIRWTATKTTGPFMPGSASCISGRTAQP